MAVDCFLRNRLLDKAAILREGTEPQPWKVCTVTQVEEVKILKG
jgi:peptide/histidine transporter 3/4